MRGVRLFNDSSAQKVHDQNSPAQEVASETDLLGKAGALERWALLQKSNLMQK
jgi:hypothetical protein